MSDYLYSLESHLNPFQNRVVAELQELATASNHNLYLAGGAIRDLLGGSPTRDLDFVIESAPGELARTLAARLEGDIVAQDDRRGVVELLFSGRTTVEVAMSRTEKFENSGMPPLGVNAPIYDDLRRRDFTINGIALKLNRGSKGLLIDPMNGIADLERKELRAGYSTALYDDPVRLLRAVRFKHRFKLTVEPRTQRQFENAIAEELHRQIPVWSLAGELKRLGDEPSPVDVVRDLESSGLLSLYSGALAGNVNYSGLSKLEKLKKSLPLPPAGWTEGWRSFAIVLSGEGKLAVLDHVDEECCRKLREDAKTLEAVLKSPNLRRPSQIYGILSVEQPDTVLFVLYNSDQRLVLDRIRNYIQKYLPLAQEIPDAEFAAAGIMPGTPQYERNRTTFIAARLNARPKKVEADFAGS
jgi:hypothetical protein